MSILLDKETPVLVQGITGRSGHFHTLECMEYGTRVVAGVTPGKGGQRFQDRVPVYDTVREAVLNEGGCASLIFVPPAFAADSILEAIDADLELIVCITEGIPVRDMWAVKHALLKKPGVRLIGPNCPGIITPGQAKMGIMPGYIHKAGRVGVVSRSGTLTYEAVWQLTQLGIGQSTCIGIGGDPISGTSHLDAIKMLNEDPDTDALVLIGEIGGESEEEAARYIKDCVDKPVAAFIAGTTAPEGKRMGHAGAVISGSRGTAQAKIDALRDAGVAVTLNPSDIAATLAGIYSA